MDATPASDNGFDAALKALEDLETSEGETATVKPAISPAPVSPSIGAIGLSDADEPDDVPAIITAVPHEEIETIVPALVDEPVGEPDPAAAQAPVATDPAPLPAPADPAAGRLGKFAIGLALFSSVLSAAGLIVAERTIMSAQLVVADARERQQQLEKANKLIQDLELIRDRQIELLQMQQAQVARPPVTSEELRQRMLQLQEGLIARDPVNKVVQAVQAGQADNTARFSEFSMKLARVEAALDRR